MQGFLDLVGYINHHGRFIKISGFRQTFGGLRFHSLSFAGQVLRLT